jgi:hypothetical protein
MSWWKCARGLSPGPAAIPNPASPSGLAARLLRTRPARRGWAGAVARESRASGSCRGRYHTDRQPGALQYTARCPEGPGVPRPDLNRRYRLERALASDCSVTDRELWRRA